MTSSNSIDCRAAYDIRLIPPESVSRTDRFEVRLQARAGAGILEAEFYLDEVLPEALLHREQCRLRGDEYGFFRFFPDLRKWRTGRHRIISVLRNETGEIRVEKAFELQESESVRLSGGFIMIGPPNDRRPCDAFRAGVKSLTDSQWREHINSWNEIGMRTIIITATYQPLTIASGKIHTHYPSRYFPQTPDLASSDPVAAILDAAQRNGQQVFIGLGHFGESEQLADIINELYERYHCYSSFYGWYASIEFSTAWGCWDGAGSYWAAIRKQTSQLSPAMPIMISPYMETLGFNAIADIDIYNPEDRAVWYSRGVHPEFRRYLIDNPMRPDILMPQDGVGGVRHHQTVEGSCRYFAAFKETADAAGIHLWANCESFELNEFTKPPISRIVPRYLNGGFDGEAGLVQQMSAVRPYVEKILTFALTGLFSRPGLPPEIGGTAAVEQYEKYREYLKHPRPGFRNLALGKRYRKSMEPHKNLADSLNGKATDGNISGGYSCTIDDCRLFGYTTTQSDNGALSVDILIDLDCEQEIDVIRCAGAFRRVRGYADRITFAVGNTPESMRELGSTASYHNGWAEFACPAGVCARYVRATFQKNFKKEFDDQNWHDCWLLIDEIEVLQHIGTRFSKQDTAATPLCSICNGITMEH